MDNFEVCSVQFNPVYCSYLSTCSEDGLFCTIDTESEDSDAYITLNVEESGFRVGYLTSVEAYVITISGLKTWVAAEDEDPAMPSELRQQLCTKPDEYDYFITTD